jgi:hypothetical protein
MSRPHSELALVCSALALAAAAITITIMSNVLLIYQREHCTAAALAPPSVLYRAEPLQKDNSSAVMTIDGHWIALMSGCDPGDVLTSAATGKPICINGDVKPLSYGGSTTSNYR